ncbi:MAG: nitronate monooxygenase [Candidatus Cloacimonetes bacterium 4572_65]|nr:MAG: nitronate monooxygenase [Candidatus Cloacimonetes bacterium 4572_65]
MRIKMPQLKIGDLVAKLPIVQGGMGVGISLSGLASTVANEGGIGVLSAVGLGVLRKGKTKEEDNLALRDEIRKTRKLTDGIIGLNVMVALTNFDDLVCTALNEKIDVLFMGAGLPLKMPKMIDNEFLNETKTKFAVIVSSARAAKVIFKTWAKKFSHVPDAVVVEGPKAGGHLGFTIEQIEDENFKLEKLVPEIVAAIKPFEEKFNKKIPLIAGGGIYSGKDIKDIMDLGADAVQLGTRFVTTTECDASDEFKQSFIDCKEEDIVLIKSPVGLPGRAIKNDFLTKVYSGITTPFSCPWKCLITCDYKTAPYCIAIALLNSKLGNLKNGFAFAGSNAFLCDKVISVKELMETLQDEYSAALKLFINSCRTEALVGCLNFLRALSSI